MEESRRSPTPAQSMRCTWRTYNCWERLNWKKDQTLDRLEVGDLNMLGKQESVSESKETVPSAICVGGKQRNTSVDHSKKESTKQDWRKNWKNIEKEWKGKDWNKKVYENGGMWNRIEKRKNAEATRKKEHKNIMCVNAARVDHIVVHWLDCKRRAFSAKVT